MKTTAAAAARRARTRNIRPTITHTPAVALAVFLFVFCAGASLRAQSAAPPARAEDPFERRGWHLELAGAGVIETWNYNLDHEELWGPYAGLTYGLGKGVVLLAGGPLYYVSQRGVDAWMLGATWGVRSRITRVRRACIFWDFEVGISEADTNVPPRGTRFNFLAKGSGGATLPVRRGVHLLAALRWVHVSNGGKPAGRDRNPDTNAVGLRTGVLIAF